MPINSRILKLKQKLKAWNLLPEGFTPQQRRLAYGLGGLCLALLAYVLVLSPLISLVGDWSTELDQKRLLLAKYQGLKASQDKVAKANRDLKSALGKVEGQFLAGASAALAASDLQEILKNLAGTYGVQLTSTKVLPPREAGAYQEVPVQVQMSINAGQLVTFLYHLEHHTKLLFVSELEINAPRSSVAGREYPMQVNLVVSGLIKAGPAKKGAAA